MSNDLQVKIHAIAEDGLPDMDNLAGRVAFIFEGCVVSGWPLDASDPDVRRNMSSWLDVDALTETLWEGDSDVAGDRMFHGVTHWVEFPLPIWNISGGNG